MSNKNDIPKQTIHIETGGGERLDIFLAEKFSDFSRTYFKRLINKRQVLVDGHAVSPDHELKRSQTIQIVWPPKKKKIIGDINVPLPFPVLYEDQDLLVIDKPPRLLCHPTGGASTAVTLVDLLLPHVSREEWPEEVRPGLVHRLDRDTSGVMVYAKTPEAQAKLSKQFALRRVQKTYVALVIGAFEPKEGRLECYLARDPQHRLRFIVTAEGRQAITDFKVLETWGSKASLIELYPKTGRTHQLRVQLSWYKYPIVGDALYGGRKKGFEYVDRHMLHAKALEFFHPTTQEKMRFEAPLPLDFQEVIKIIRSSP